MGSTGYEQYPQAPQAPPPYHPTSFPASHAAPPLAEKPPPPPVAAAPPRALVFGHPAFSRSLTLTDPGSGRDVYHVRTSTFTPGAPDVTLHAGADKHGPVLAVAHLHTFQDDRIGLGDPAVWETLRSESAVASRYAFGATIAGRRHEFAWERTHSSRDGVTGLKKLSGGNYRLVDVQTGQTVAVYLIAGGVSWGDQGTLRFEMPVPQDLERWIVLTASTLVVKAQRRSNAAAGGAGGGGGGGAC